LGAGVQSVFFGMPENRVKERNTSYPSKIGGYDVFPIDIIILNLMTLPPMVVFRAPENTE